MQLQFVFPCKRPGRTVMSLITIVVVLATLAFIIRTYQKSTNARCTSTKRLDRKTAIVTGGTAGMGLEIAKEFARRGAKVIIACPIEREGLIALKSIVDETGNENVVFKLLDLGSLRSVREFAEDILKTEERLDLLINNAGIAVLDDYQTKDGMNFVMQVNYYSHFLLTNLLIPLLKKSGRPSEPSRIVNTSSIMHYVGRIDIENMNKSGYYWSPVFQYANSKISVIPFSRELTRRLRCAHCVVNCVDPGAVGTGIYMYGGRIYAAIVSNLFYHFFKTPWEGAQTALHVALDDQAGEVSGELFVNCKLSRAKSSAYSDGAARRLWDDSVRLVKLTEKELALSFN